MHGISQLPTQQKAQELFLRKMSLGGVEMLTDTWEVCNVMLKQGNRAAETNFLKIIYFMIIPSTVPRWHDSKQKVILDQQRPSHLTKKKRECSYLATF